MNFDHPTPATQNGLGNVIRGWPRWMFCQAFEKHKLCSSWDILCIYIYVYIYICIYIYGTPPKPMQTSILLVFTVNFIYFGTDFVPIKFEAPTVGKLKNWKTEKLNFIGEVWGPFFSCGIQFFSFSVLGFSWKVKTRKAEKTEKLKNWIP